MESQLRGGIPFAVHKHIFRRRWNMWIVFSLLIMAILSAIFGLRGFFVGLLNLIGTTLYYLWKGIEILDFISSVCEILQLIFQLLSLLG